MRGRNRHNRGNRPEQYENESRNRYGSQYDNQYSDQYGEREQRWGSPGRGVEQDRYQQRQGWDEERSWRGRNDQPAEENLGWPAPGPAEYGCREQGQGRYREDRVGGNFGNRESQRSQDRYGSDTENYGGAGYAQRSAYERMGQGGGQHRGKGPKGYQRSDDRIREDVSEALSQDGDIDASEIEVTIQGGVVTLSGTVDSREAKRAAEDLAEDCPGVKDVQNNIRVQAKDQRGQSGLGNMSQDYSGAGAGTSRQEGETESRARTRSPAGSPA